MFYLNRDTELNEKLLHKMIDRFTLHVEPKLTKYKKYYDGIHAILQKSYADPSKPCNRTITNIVKNIADSYAGYLASPGCISYSSSEDIEMIMDVLRYNDHQSQDASFLLDALVYGVGVELMYADKDSHIRFRTINPTQCFGVYDDTLTGDLMYFVRFYKVDDWDDNDKYQVDVYDDLHVKHYTMAGLNGELSLMNEELHFFSQCPANIFYLPDEKSIFDCVMSQQDSYNELLSAEVDDYQAFCDAYLALEACDADGDDIAQMKENRVLVLPDGSRAYFVVKPVNDAQVENMLKRIQDSMYRIAACPDFSSESFVGGVSSGIAIQYRLTGMETRAGKIEAEMKKALQRRIEIICGMASLKLGEAVFRDVEITFKRNIPNDVATTINLVNALKGTVSDETLLSQLDFITDVGAELERIQKQKQDNMAVYGFGAFGSNEDEEEDVEE